MTIFLCYNGDIIAFLSLAIIDSISLLCLGTILSSEVANKRHINVQLNRTQKDICLTTAGNMNARWLRFFVAHTAHLWITTREPQILILGNKFYRAGKFGYREWYLWMMRIDCISSLSLHPSIHPSTNLFSGHETE